jgi:DNA-directed primase/polymerase protein
VQLWTTFIRTRLAASHGVRFSDADVVDLDSTTDAKFSRHLIIKLDGGRTAFLNNEAMGLHLKSFAHSSGAFVEDAVREVREQADSNSELAQLLVAGGGDAVECFVDTSVYSKNRCFRMALNSKFGKDVALRRADGAVIDDVEAFKETLVCNVSCETARLLGGEGVRLERKRRRSGAGFDLQPTVVALSSPWRAIDDHITSVWNEMAGEPVGRIRNVSLFSTGPCYVYSMSGNRYCCNIGRQHKSNGITIVLDVSRMCFFQRCFDTECRGFRSNEFLIPQEIWPLSEKAENLEKDEEALESLCIPQVSSTADEDDLYCKLLDALDEFTDLL